MVVTPHIPSCSFWIYERASAPVCLDHKISAEDNGLARTRWSAPTNSAKLEIFDVRTQKWSDLVPGKLAGSVVNWAHSPDYKYVYYTTGGAEPKAMRVRLADHKIENIAI